MYLDVFESVIINAHLKILKINTFSCSERKLWSTLTKYWIGAQWYAK